MAITSIRYNELGNKIAKLAEAYIHRLRNSGLVALLQIKLEGVNTFD